MSKKLTIALSLLAAVIFMFTAFVCPSKALAKSYKFSITLSELSPWYAGAKMFADLVKARTDDKIKIDIYPNQQLSGGNLVKGLQMLQTGAIDMAFNSSIHFSLVDPRFIVVSMPWIMPNYEAVDRVLDGPVGKALMNCCIDNKIEPLGMAGDGFRQITNNVREITKPSDLNGLRIRIPGLKMYISTFKHLGANASAMNFAELYGALQRGAMDGQENPISTIVSAKLHEVQKYCSLWNYSYHVIILGVNKKLWDSFDKGTQKILRETAREVCFYERMVARKMDGDLVQTMIKKGVKVTALTQEQIEAFIPLIQPVYKEFAPIIGTELLEKFRSLGQQ
jgi:tripartite ATP-independent transporter DctP family solute receptor